MSEPPLTLVTWLLAAAPVVLLFAAVLSGRLPTSRAALLVAAVVAVIAAMAFRADVTVLGVAVGKGLWLGLWILCVVWPALLLYRVAETAGLDRIGRVLASILPRREETLLLLAWLFPSFLQGVAGFGTPIAVCAPLLVAAGWRPMRAVLYALVGYHWSVTFGSMGSSFYMAALTARLDPGGQADFAFQAASALALNCLAAGALVLVLDGGWPALRRGARMLLVVGVPMASTLVGAATLVPAVASLSAGAAGFVAAFALSLVDRRRRVPAVQAAGGDGHTAGPGDADRRAPAGLSPLRSAQVLSPYLFLLLTALPVFLVPFTREWVGAHLVVGPSFPDTVTGFGWVNDAVARYTPVALFGHPGFYVLLAAVLGYLTYRLCDLWPRRRTNLLGAWMRSLPKSSMPILLLACVATMMADTGMVSTLARGVAGVTGQSFPLLSPLVGGTGSFMTGSTTTSNALFAGLQRDVAVLLDLKPAILLAAQTAGGNVGNALAPVVVVIGLSAVGEPDRTSEIFRRCLPPAAVLFCLVAVVTLARAVL